MKFECNEISIDEGEFGLTVSLSENKDVFNPEIEYTFDEIIDSIGQFITIQLTYGEDEFEEDYYYFESSDEDNSGELNDFEIVLSENQFVMTKDDETFEIQINTDTKMLNELKNVLLQLTKNKGKLNIL